MSRVGRTTLLVSGALALVLTLVSVATPAGPHGPLVDLALTLAVMGTHLALIAAALPRLERGLRADAVLPAATVLAAALGAGLTLAVWLVAPGQFAPGDALGPSALSGAMIGAVLLGFYVLAVRHPRALEEARALRLESEIAALRGRLEPHFLLNSLTAIAGLVTADPAGARRALAALGDLLTDALERDPARPHTVDAEVAWLRAYLTIFEARYGAGLQVRWTIAPGLGAVPLPRLVVQPLVENALVHGIAHAGAGQVAIEVAAAPGGPLTIAIANTGPAVADADVVAGHGLALVRRRLALEAPGARVTLAPGPTGGTVATLVFPGPR